MAEVSFLSIFLKGNSKSKKIKINELFALGKWDWEGCVLQHCIPIEGNFYTPLKIPPLKYIDN